MKPSAAEVRKNHILVELFVITFLVLSFGCSNGDDEADNDIDPEIESRTSNCGTYPAEENSPFILPYNQGESYRIMQANCTNNSHREGTLGQFAYDFEMPIGTDILAVRTGQVVAVEESFANVTTTQRPGEENFVIINNSDGTQDRYFHLDQDGVHVIVGQRVLQGTRIATGGNSGGTPRPHLHLEVIRPSANGGTPIPLTFSNTRPHPTGLIAGESYEAN